MNAGTLLKAESRKAVSLYINAMMMRIHDGMELYMRRQQKARPLLHTCIIATHTHEKAVNKVPIQT
jgi:hypothetical protein